MTQVLYPVSDGGAVGDLQTVGGIVRYEVLNPHLYDDERRVEIKAMEGAVFDQHMQAQGPIEFGDGILHTRVARVGGAAGIQFSVSLWKRHPRLGPGGIIASIPNINVWHDDFRDYVKKLIANKSDAVAENMTTLWIRVHIVAAFGGPGIPTLGISSLGVETPNPSLLNFQHPTESPPVENAFTKVKTYSGRTATARYEQGEWYDEDGKPFETDKHSLPRGEDGILQASRGVNGWASEGGGLVYATVISDDVAIEGDSSAIELG